jgi:hypothetical protein
MADMLLAHLKDAVKHLEKTGGAPAEEHRSAFHH